MKFRRHLIYLLTLLPTVVLGAEYKATVSVKNNSGKAQKDAPVVIRLKELEGLDFAVRSARVMQGHSVVDRQLDDMDNDGRKDELCFVCNLSGNETKQFDIVLSSEDTYASLAIPRVYADMQLDDKKKNHPYITCLEAPGDSYLYNDLYHHGVAFESELTAYRIYFDERQNIDLYGKKSYKLELHDTSFYTNAEQQSQGYGNDVLWAGQSVGCGSLKLWDGTGAMNWKKVRTRGQRLISAGPVRTVVELTDRGVDIEGASLPYDVRTVYTLYAGHREVRVDIHLDRPMEAPFLCTGVQKIGVSDEARQSNGGIAAEGYVKPDGLAVSWGSDYPEMGKKEQFPPEPVGLAIRVPEEYISKVLTDELNYLIVIGKSGQQDFHYFVSFCAAKETEGFHSAKEWFSHAEGWDTADHLTTNVIRK